ncbi:hypothetical protein CDD83_1848 [Cordyceps sp. RAO-2017]|nr:hypothetical protein CDD83_1848 [Cordyceps sp. RAO-2017]
MRIDRPAGFYAFYLPYLTGLLYAACVVPTTPAPASLAALAALLLPFNVFLRGAACAWNDNVDQDFDRRVERCRNRPIARHAVSTAQAHIFTSALLAVVFLMLRLLPPDCTPHMVVTVALLFVYALMKRVTHYPQVFLGVPLAWAVFFCLAALGLQPLGDRMASTLALFAAIVFWTVVYDTIYAHQDVADDEKAGVKSMAVRYRSSTKRLASALGAVQVAILALAGSWAGFGPVYFIGTVGGVAAAMAYYIYSVDLKRPESCAAWFHYQFWLVGAGFVAGFGGQYISRFM